MIPIVGAHYQSRMPLVAGPPSGGLLPGPQGPAGADGVDGINGIDGVDGVDGTDGADGAEGPMGPEGPQGPAGEQGPPGEKTAIVETSEGFRKMYCEEGTQVWFHHRVKGWSALGGHYQVDGLFLEMVELDSVHVSSVAAEYPWIVWAKFDKQLGMVVFDMQVLASEGRGFARVNFTISGVRKGFEAVYMSEATRKEFDVNNERWLWLSGRKDKLDG
jgi:hypothetical protein